MRVVLDTNILVSALFWEGNEWEIYTKASSRDIASIVSPELITEFQRVIVGKHHVPTRRATTLVDEILEFSELVHISGELRVVEDDPDDDIVIETAVVGCANIILTGDRHLLRLKRFNDIVIMRTKEFLDTYSSNPLVP